jgi:CBS domain-containing protein
MRAQHFMSLNPVACASDQTCAEVARLMRDRAVGCVVVLEGEQVVGLVTDRMLVTTCMAEAMDPQQTPVEEVMVRDVACVSPEATIFAVVDVLRGAHLARRVPVVGPRRELLGLVSIADIAVVAKDLIDAVLQEETQHSLKRARALTGGKRIAKRIRRPTKMGRLPDAEPIAKRGPSRPGPVRNVYRNPSQRPGRRGLQSERRNPPSTFYPVGGGPGGPQVSRRQR